jgi:hypothetical protein
LLRIYGNTNVLARARVEKELLSMSWSLAVIFNQLGYYSI